MKQFYLFLAIATLLSCSKDKEDEGGSPAITNFTVTQNNGELLFAYSSNIDINYYEISYNESNGGTVNGGDGYRFTTSQPASDIKSIQELNVYTNWSYLFFIRGIGTNNTTTEWFGPVYVTLNAYCEEPSNLNFSGSISWENSNPATAYYQVQYGLQGFALGSGTILQTNEQSVQDLVLVQGNVYEAYVRNYCNGGLGWSGWNGPVNYYATDNLNVCGLPNNLGYYTEYNFFGDPVGANISWGDPGNNKKYEFTLVGNGQSPSTGALQTREDYGKQITYTQLYTNVDYDFYVRTVCLDGTRTNWVGPLDIRIN